MKLPKDQKILLKIFRKYINKNDKILDVGCGVGRNLKLLKLAGFNNIHGTDISDKMLSITKGEGFNVINNVEVDNFSENKFDVLLFSHVIEHINEDEIQIFVEK